jgi:hypothetical protein
MQIFDLTKEIHLDKKLRKQYTILRASLHVVFLLTMLFVMYRILFPIVPLDFLMDTPNSIKNTLASMHLEKTGQFPEKKNVPANDSLVFSANPVGHFSKASITFTTEKNSADVENANVKIQKSYQAFFYPTGGPMGFKDASLLSTPDAKYYFVSNGKIRKFANIDIIVKLGYPKSAFVDVSLDDIKLNKAGDDIVSTEQYPDDTLFAIDDVYYQLKNEQLFAFISPQAFLSQYDGVSAIAKKTDFLSRYPVSETLLGFRDGILVSSADSVFILSQGKSYPIENAETFLSLGFAWEDVTPVSANELSIYAKQKQFTNNFPHPDGTIFLDKKANQYFIIKNKQKLTLSSDAIIKAYSKQKPILASISDAKTEISCKLQKNIFQSNTYSCEASLESLSSFIGNGYQVTTAFPKNITITTVNATFSTPISLDSFKTSLSIIKTRIQNRL